MMCLSKRCTSSRVGSIGGRPLLLPRAFAGTATLLLPVAVQLFSKSLPHLLPRQAFSFCAWNMSATTDTALGDIKFAFTCEVF